MPPVNIEISLDRSKGTNPNIGTLNLSQLPGVVGNYAVHGMATAMRRILDGEPHYDAVQLRAGPFSSAFIGSYALGRLVIPQLEARVGLDSANSTEIKSVAHHYAFADEDGVLPDGIGSLPWAGAEDSGGTWSDRRAFWREAMHDVEYDPAQIGDELDSLVTVLRDSSHTIDVKHLAYAEVVQQLLGTVLGSDISPEESALIAETLMLSERSVTESMVTGFHFKPKGKYTRRYEAAKQHTGKILEQRILDGSNERGAQLLELVDDSIPAAKTELMHMLAGSRGTGNSIYWGLKRVYSDPELLTEVRDQMSDDLAKQLALSSISSHPGAPIATRSPEQPLHIRLMDGDAQVGTLYTGRRGRIVVSSYAWGQDKKIQDADRGRAAFGVGRRRCPGEKVVLGVAPHVMGHIISNYNLVFAESDLSGHGLSLSPRPNGRATISAAPSSSG